MRKPVLSILAAAVLAACAHVPQPHDQVQTVAVIEGAYTAAATAEANFLATGAASPATKATIKELDAKAYAALVVVRPLARAGVLVPADELAGAQAAVGAFASYLAAKGTH